MARRVLRDQATLSVKVERLTMAELEKVAARDGLTPQSYARMILLRHLRHPDIRAIIDREGK